jgi:hypothetical protein
MVVIGKNQSGKTSLASALAYACHAQVAKREAGSLGEFLQDTQGRYTDAEAYFSDLSAKDWGRSFAAFTLPAERNALILQYKLLSQRRLVLLREHLRALSALKNRPQRAALPTFVDALFGMGVPSARPTETFLDFLAQCEIQALSGGGRANQKSLVQIAQRLEQALFPGESVTWTNNPSGLGSELRLRLRDGAALDLHLASSATKQVASLLLWLRHGAHDVLIVDEPELNLHPIAQAKVLEALALAVRSGVYVFLSTHSADIMAHLNNLIASDFDRPQVQAEQARHLLLGDGHAFLRPEEVGAFQLEEGALRDLHDPDYGIRWDTLSEGAVDIQQRFFRIRALARGDDGEALP